jgi:uncharacterized protein YigA (DUF484 family)
MEEPRPVPAIKTPAEPTAEDVAHYLAAHPDFLANRAELLASLVPPAAHAPDRKGDGVFDFQHFMVRKLQSELQAEIAERQELLAIVRDNQSLSTRIHAAVLALLEAPSFADMINTLTSDLTIYLDVDVVALVIEKPADGAAPLHRHDIHLVPAGRIDECLDGHDVVLEEIAEGDSDIYGDAASLIRSQVLLRLEVSRHAPLAMLVFGSRESGLFQAGQSIELIGFLARTVERLTRAWLALPE